MTLSTKTILFAIVVIFAFFNVSHGEGIEFDYVGSKGPEFWHLLSEESAICATGKQQSPINIVKDDLKTFAVPPNPMFQDAKDVESTNNGNTVEISSGTEGVPLPAEITIDGEKYELQQFHFHTPSEHRVDGRHRDVEQHLVFKSKSEKISVVAVFYDVGSKESMFMMPIVKNLPKNVGDKKEIKSVGLASLLKDTKNITEAFTYSGSLTTPPCTEGVTWYVNQGVQDISLNQFLSLREVTGFNSRFTKLRVDDEQPGSPTEQPAEQPTGTPSIASTEQPTATPSATETPSTDGLTDDPNVTSPTSPTPSSEPYYKFKRSLYSRNHLRKSR